MNNLYLNDLVKKSNLHPDDAENINRIFYILSEERQKHILENWEDIVFKIKISRNKMNKEKENITKIFDAKKDQENMFK